MSQLPPYEPPDLRDPNRRPSGQQPPQQGGQYPPQQPGYPPQQGGQYPPQQPGYPPQQGGQYPPPQQGGYNPPPPARGGTGSLAPRQAPPLGNRSTQQYTPSLDDASVPQLGRDNIDPVESAMHERRIEYLAWGSVVFLLGIAIMLVPLSDGKAGEFLLLVAPLVGGSILMLSGFIQKIGFGFDVSVFTWGSGIFCLAFGITQWIARLTDSNDLVSQAIYFVGLLVVFTGMVLILQVFSRPKTA
jgi:hypothetical protein